MMLTDNNQIFRNCFVIIYCHLTKISSQINKCMIFEPNERSITISTLWVHVLFWPSRSPDLNPIENVWSYIAKEWDHRNERTPKAVDEHAWRSGRASESLQLVYKTSATACHDAFKLLEMQKGYIQNISYLK